MENKHLLSRLRNAAAHASCFGKEEEEQHPAREEIRYWLSFLTPSSVIEGKSLSKDLSLIGKAISSIAEATEEEILTEKEADAITRFLIAKFIERRFDTTLRDLVLGTESHWFIGTSKYFRE
jgi:hypothetical protein